jgi:hypothetical protein
MERRAEKLEHGSSREAVTLQTAVMGRDLIRQSAEDNKLEQGRSLYNWILPFWRRSSERST